MRGQPLYRSSVGYEALRETTPLGEGWGADQELAPRIRSSGVEMLARSRRPQAVGADTSGCSCRNEFARSSGVQGMNCVSPRRAELPGAGSEKPSRVSGGSPSARPGLAAPSTSELLARLGRNCCDRMSAGPRDIPKAVSPNSDWL